MTLVYPNKATSPFYPPLAFLDRDIAPGEVVGINFGDGYLQTLLDDDAVTFRLFDKKGHLIEKDKCIDREVLFAYAITAFSPNKIHSVINRGRLSESYSADVYPMKINGKKLYIGIHRDVLIKYLKCRGFSDAQIDLLSGNVNVRECSIDCPEGAMLMDLEMDDHGNFKLVEPRSADLAGSSIADNPPLFAMERQRREANSPW